MRVVPVVLAALLVLPPGCAGYSRNHRDGLMLLGGAAVITGTIMAIDGGSCTDGDVGNVADHCRADGKHRDFVLGVTTLIGGLVLGGLAYAFKPHAGS